MFPEASRAFLCKWKQKQEKNSLQGKVEMERKMGPKSKKEQQRSLKAVKEGKVEKQRNKWRGNKNGYFWVIIPKGIINNASNDQ